VTTGTPAAAALFQQGPGLHHVARTCATPVGHGIDNSSNNQLGRRIIMPDGHGDLSKAHLLNEQEREKSVVIVDPSRPDQPIIYVSEAFEAQTGYPPEETLGRNCRFLQGRETDPRAARAIREALAAQTEITIDILNYRKDGVEFWNRLRIRPLFDENGKLLYFVGAQNPIPAEDVRSHPIEAVFD
jgi:PAS domain S-box-containing protein